jgi:hypothetical protein
MNYAAFNVPSYQKMQGTPTRSHLGSQSHNGTQGAPVNDPGGYTAGAIGSGTPTKLEKGAPSGMDM